MRKNKYTENYDITIVGGGLAGKLMLTMLINCGEFNKNKLSWINSSLNLYLITLFFIISAFHFKLGLTVIIEDYIHNSIVKKYLIVIISIIALLIASLSLGLCVYKNLGG